MANKFYGAIGYAKTEETAKGVWEVKITEKNYYCELIKNYKRSQPGEGINDDMVLSNQVSIIADPYATQQFYNMKYVTWQNTKWKVTSVDVQFPRLLLTLGGVYNGG